DLKNVDDLQNGDYYYHFNNFLKINNFWSFQFCNKGNHGYFYINSKKTDIGYVLSSTFLPRAVYKNFEISPVDSWNVAKFDPNDFKDDSLVIEMYSRVLNVNENDNP